LLLISLKWVFSKENKFSNDVSLRIFVSSIVGDGKLKWQLVWFFFQQVFFVMMSLNIMEVWC
jgi:hypothetical protein